MILYPQYETIRDVNSKLIFKRGSTNSDDMISAVISVGELLWNENEKQYLHKLSKDIKTIYDFVFTVVHFSEAGCSKLSLYACSKPWVKS